jgi:hypothetical protein
MQMPLGELSRHEGYEVVFADAGDRVNQIPSVTLSDLQGFDVIVAQRWNRHEGLEIWRRARTPFSRLVYETDDDIFHITAENWDAFNLYGNPVIQDAVAHAAEVADLVTVSTEPLARVMRQFNPNVAVLGNAVPGWVLELPRPQRDRPRVGWTGAASHGVDIGIVAAPVRRFLKRFGNWDFVSGATDYRPTIRAAASRMFYQPWIQVNTDPAGFYGAIDYDIGLAPLWPTTFAESKSGLKAIEHGARGIPTIATDCPAYREVIEHGVNGFLVKRDHEWLRYMSELAGDDALRARMGEAARDMARRHLIEDRWADWAAAYTALFPAG